MPRNEWKYEALSVNGVYCLIIRSFRIYPHIPQYNYIQVKCKTGSLMRDTMEHCRVVTGGI